MSKFRSNSKTFRQGRAVFDFTHIDTDNSLIVQSFVETIEDHNVIYYDLLHVEDGKVTKAFQFTATDKERTKFLEDLANAKDKVETTTAMKA